MFQSFLTPEIVATELNLTPRTIRNWLNKNQLPGVKLPRGWRVLEREYKEWKDQYWNGDPNFRPPTLFTNETITEEEDGTTEEERAAPTIEEEIQTDFSQLDAFAVEFMTRFPTLTIPKIDIGKGGATITKTVRIPMAWNIDIENIVRKLTIFDDKPSYFYRACIAIGIRFFRSVLEANLTSILDPAQDLNWKMEEIIQDRLSKRRTIRRMQVVIAGLRDALPEEIDATLRFIEEELNKLPIFMREKAYLAMDRTFTRIKLDVSRDYFMPEEIVKLRKAQQEADELMASMDNNVIPFDEWRAKLRQAEEADDDGLIDKLIDQLVDEEEEDEEG